MAIIMPDTTAQRLNDEAERVGLPVDELIVQISEEYFGRKERFERTAEYLLSKNADLYRRLAQ